MLRTPPPPNKKKNKQKKTCFYPFCSKFNIVWGGMRRSPFLLKCSFELFKKLNWLPLHVEVKVNICIQVHSRINGHSPSFTNDLLVLNSDINDRNSRNRSLNLVCPRFKRETEGDVRTFSGRSARLWNAIPNSLKKIECVLSFKKALIDFFASS